MSELIPSKTKSKAIKRTNLEDEPGTSLWTAMDSDPAANIQMTYAAGEGSDKKVTQPFVANNTWSKMLGFAIFVSSARVYHVNNARYKVLD